MIGGAGTEPGTEVPRDPQEAVRRYYALVDAGDVPGADRADGGSGGVAADVAGEVVEGAQRQDAHLDAGSGQGRGGDPVLMGLRDDVVRGRPERVGDEHRAVLELDSFARHRFL